MRICYSILLTLLAVIASAQEVFKLEPILKLTSGERRNYFATYYPNILEDGNTENARTRTNLFLKAYKEIAYKYGNKELKLDADFTEIYYKIRCDKNINVSVLKVVDSILVIAQKEKFKYILAWVQWEGFVLCFNNLKQYEKGFEYGLDFEHTLAQLSVEEFPDKTYFMLNLSDTYLNFGDNKGCIRTAKNAIKDKDADTSKVHRLYNTIGLAYQQLEQYDSAIYYLQQGIQYIQQYNSEEKAWINIIKGNIGECMISQQQFKEALPYVQADEVNAALIGDGQLQANALLNLTNIYIQFNNIEAASSAVYKAKELLKNSSSSKRLAKLYKALAAVEKLKGNYQIAIVFADSVAKYTEIVTKEFNTIQILRSEQKKAKRIENELLIENEKKILQRNFLIIGVLLSSLVAFFIYKQQKKKLQQQKTIELLKLQNKQQVIDNQQQELTLFAQQLEEFKQSISAKNIQLEQVNNSINIANNQETLEQLQQLTILTEDEWQNFKLLFNRVHIGFFDKLHQKYPELTVAEVRYLALVKLNLSNKEMANTLGVSPHAVRSIWYRMRKKIDLSENTKVEELVASVQ